MSADILRRAAAKLREHAHAASRGPWFAVERTGTFPHELVVAVERRWTKSEDPDDRGQDDVFVMPIDTGGFQFVRAEAIADVQYTALMHPPVALALAAWLDREAATAERYEADTGQSGSAVLDASGATGCARAILREEES